MWTGRPDLRKWKAVVQTLREPKRELTITMVGKYVDLTESYKSIHEALVHGGAAIRAKVNIPMHYNTFDVIKADASEFVAKIEKTGGMAAVIEPGGTYEL